MIIQVIICAIVLLLLLCLYIFITSVCVEFLLFTFLLVDYNVRSLNKPKLYPPMSLSGYARKFACETLYAFGKYYYAPLSKRSFTVQGTNATTAVLLIHGYCRTQTDWLWMRKRIANSNRNVFMINLAPDFAPIEEIAQSIARKIALIKSSTKCQKLILIGHSMGGIAASYYKEFIDQEQSVAAVITIASPLYGTRVSVVGSGTNAVQMCPRSPFLAALRTKMRNNPHQYYQIASSFDNLVFPWQSALFAHTPDTQQAIMSFTTHLGTLHSKEVAAQLNKWLEILI